MKVKSISLLSLYADELLKLIFSEDQAASYVEGFVVLSGDPAVRKQMSRLQDETNMHLISILELFKAVDPEMNQCADKLESEVAYEMAARVDASNMICEGDDALVSAVLRLQDYLLERYRRVIEFAHSVGSTYDRSRLEEISMEIRVRRKAIWNLRADEPRQGLRARLPGSVLRDRIGAVRQLDS